MFTSEILPYSSHFVLPMKGKNLTSTTQVVCCARDENERGKIGLVPRLVEIHTRNIVRLYNRHVPCSNVMGNNFFSNTNANMGIII